MTHVSRKKLSDKTEKEIKSALKSVFTNLKPKELEIIVSTLITKTEEIMMAKRLATILMLSEGATYEQVSNSLKLTEQTISRIHFDMNSSPQTYNLLIKKLTPWKRKELLKAVAYELGFQGLSLFAKHAGGRIY